MKIAIWFILILLGFLIFVRFMESGFIYYPSKEIDKIPSVDIYSEEVFFRTEDREILWGIFVPAKQENAGVIIYFHGNAGNISSRMDVIFNLYKLGYNVFAFDYRGYGKSSGKPDEEGLYKDGRAALEYISERPEVDNSDIVFFGESLGTAVAINLAQNSENCTSVIIVGGFPSASDMGARMFPYLPLYLFAKSKFDSVKKIKNVNIPILIIHGTRDEIVPISLAEKLFNEANAPKKFMPVYGAGHNDIYEWDNGIIFQVIAGFLKGVL